MGSGGFTHIAFAVRNLDETVRFYERFAAMTLVHERHDGNSRVAWLSDLRRAFVLVVADGPRTSTAMGTFAHLGVEVESRAEVDRFAVEADSEGLLVAGPKQSGQLYWIYVRDPDGHNLEISHGGESVEAVVAAAQS